MRAAPGRGPGRGPVWGCCLRGGGGWGADEGRRKGERGSPQSSGRGGRGEGREMARGRGRAAACAAAAAALVAVFGAAAAARVPGGAIGGASGASSSSSAAAGAAAPWFCHGLDCPRYETEGSGEGFEIRKYPASKWASTEVKGLSLDKGMSTGFMRLFHYISVRSTPLRSPPTHAPPSLSRMFFYFRLSLRLGVLSAAADHGRRQGENEAQAKIPMAAPVTVRIKPGAGPACEQDFVVSFFVPFADQASPTPATSPDIYIEEREQMDTVYVASYGGWSREDDVISNAKKLADALQKAGMAFDDSEFFYAGYDSPFRILRRHNEVWFRAPSGPAATGRGASA